MGVSLIAQKRDAILPIVFEALYTNSRSHWNSTVHGLTCNVVKLFMEMDPKLFDDCSATFQAKQKEEIEEIKVKEKKWSDIEEAAERDALYEKVKHVLKPKVSLAYAMRAKDAKAGLQLFDDMGASMAAGAQDFSQTNTAAGPTGADALRRKSTLPGGPPP